MRNETRGAHQGWTDSVHAWFNSLRKLLGGRRSGVRARVRGNLVDGQRASKAQRIISGVMGALALSVGLLSMLGCAGGWESSKRYAPAGGPIGAVGNYSDIYDGGCRDGPAQLPVVQVRNSDRRRKRQFLHNTADTGKP